MNKGKRVGERVVYMCYLPLLHTDCLTWPSVRLDGDMEGLEFTGVCCGRRPPPTPPLGSFTSRAFLSSTTEYITFFKSLDWPVHVTKTNISS